MLGKLSLLGRPTSLDDSRARAYCACSRCGWGMFGHFSLICLFSFLSPSLLETPRYRLKYCLKGPLNPKQPTNQPTQGLVASGAFGFFRTGIPTSSYLLAASNRGWEVRPSYKIHQNWGWKARRLDPAGMIIPLLLQEPGPTRVMGRPKGSYTFFCFCFCFFT